ncbi:hypothetical protein ACFP81_11290 [Deinococcus lacus]|uniref:Uncharacterized protein n=1 Tax=Deinococcus lacus TaxID=392561 RepID=A0ABW1YI30_9DEIO
MIETLRAVHGFRFAPAEDSVFYTTAFLYATPLALVTLVLFLWSLAPAVKGEVGRGFMAWLRLCWAVFLVPAVTGVILSLGGAKVPSSVIASPEYQAEFCGQVSNLTRYCQPFDSGRDPEHWMYAGFALLSLYALEVLTRTETLPRRISLALLPVVTLFLYGVVFMADRVSFWPGSTPGQ